MNRQDRCQRIYRCFGYPASPKAVTLKAKKCDLFERINDAQPWVKLDAVEYVWWFRQTDMLWPEISMTVDKGCYSPPVVEEMA